MNRLVLPGLVSPDLADILANPSNNVAVMKQRVKQIVGARDLTSNEYTEMSRADKKRKEEIEEEKKRKKKARECKKKQMEEKKKLKLLHGIGRGRGRGRRGGHGRGSEHGCRR